MPGVEHTENDTAAGNPNEAYGTDWFLRYHDKDLLVTSNAATPVHEPQKLDTPCFRPRLSSTGESASLSKLEDMIFNIFKNPIDHKISISHFLKALTAVGIRKNDPRLKEMASKLKKIQRDLGANFDAIDAIKLDSENFKELIRSNIVFINRVLRNTLAVREWPKFCKKIEALFAKCKTAQVENQGKLATYIPQLARVDPAKWGVSVCTVDGQRFSIGDAYEPFCLQAGCTPFNYAIALNDCGEMVHKYVGQEPSGHNYNAMVLDSKKKPHNPMINAGAMVICSILKKELKIADRFDYIFSMYQKFTGGEYVGFSNQTYLSERATADRNFALGHFMRESKCFPDRTKLEDVLDLYFQSCSVEVSCDSGAVMAATLANGGVRPITGERVIANQYMRDVLSLMYSCGMNNYSGQFAFRAGLPAKSGVSGCVLLVVPDLMGACVWSPLVDDNGNSVRGVDFAIELVKACNFHTYDNTRSSERTYDPRRPEVETKAQQIVVLLFAAANGDVTALRRLLLQGMDLGIADYEGRTAMHIAAGEGHINCIKFLLETARVQHLPKDRWGRTPIDDARHHGHENIVQLLTSWDERLRNSNQQNVSATNTQATHAH